MKNHPLQKYYSGIYKSYDLVNALFTFGLDQKWRNYTVNKCLENNPSQIMDLCTGTGDLAIRLKKKAPDAAICGYDLNEEMLSLAKSKARKTGAEISFIRGSAAELPFQHESFDRITIGFGFRNLTWENPECNKHISEIHRVLKTGGKILILESARPANNIIGFFHSLYLKYILIPLGGLVSGNWNAYRYLAGSSGKYYTELQLKELLSSFGLHVNYVRKFLFGSVNLIIANKT